MASNKEIPFEMRLVVQCLKDACAGIVTALDSDDPARFSDYYALQLLLMKAAEGTPAKTVSELHNHLIFNLNQGDHDDKRGQEPPKRRLVPIDKIRIPDTTIYKLAGKHDSSLAAEYLRRFNLPTSGQSPG